MKYDQDWPTGLSGQLASEIFKFESVDGGWTIAILQAHLVRPTLKNCLFAVPLLCIHVY